MAHIFYKDNLEKAAAVFGAEVVDKLMDFMREYGWQTTYNCCLRTPGDKGAALRYCLAVMEGTTSPDLVRRLFNLA